MAKGIEINFLAGVRDFLRGTKESEQGLEDVADALDGLAREADKADVGKSLADNIERGTDEATDEVQKLERSFKELADKAGDSTKVGATRMAENTKKGTSRAKADLEELGNEARANAAETFSSFDGSAQSFADGIQGTLGGIVSSLGPIGAAAGAAGALGIGLIMSAFDQAGERSDEMKARIQELGDELIATGLKGEDGLAWLVDKLAEMATTTDDNVKSLSELRDLAGQASTDYKALAQAYAGSGDEMDKLIRSGEEYVQQLKDQAAEIADGDPKAIKSLQDKWTAQERVNQLLRDAQGEYETAAQAEDDYVAAGGKEMEAKRDALAAIGDAVDDNTSSYKDFIDAETNAADPEAWIAGIEKRNEAIDAYGENLAAISAKLNPEAYQAIVNEGIDFAPMLQAIVDGEPGLVERLNAAYTNAGSSATEALEGATPKTLPGPTLESDADTTEAKRALNRTAADRYRASIDTSAKTGDAQAQIRAAAGKDYMASIGVQTVLTNAENSLNAWLARNRTVTVQAKVVDRNGKEVY